MVRAVSSYTCRRLYPEPMETADWNTDNIVHGIGLVLEIIAGKPYTWHTWCGLRMRNPRRAGSSSTLFPAEILRDTVNCLECLAEHDPALDEHYNYEEPE